MGLWCVMITFFCSFSLLISFYNNQLVGYTYIHFMIASILFTSWLLSKTVPAHNLSLSSIVLYFSGFHFFCIIMHLHIAILLCNEVKQELSLSWALSHMILIDITLEYLQGNQRSVGHGKPSHFQHLERTPLRCKRD